LVGAESNRSSNDYVIATLEFSSDVTGTDGLRITEAGLAILRRPI
jgi:hypothetical protein